MLPDRYYKSVIHIFAKRIRFTRHSINQFTNTVPSLDGSSSNRSAFSSLYKLTTSACTSAMLLWGMNANALAPGEGGSGPGGGGSATPIPELNALAWEGVEDRLVALDNELMGDRIDLATGTLAFNQTDVSIPGNFSLEVAIRRKTAGKGLQPESAGFFADWQLDVPYMSMLMQKFTNGSSGSLYNWPSRCSGSSAPDGISSYWRLEDYWDGLNVSIPGQGMQRVLDNPNTSIYGSHSPTKSTKEHLLISCISNIGSSNGGGEGFLVKTTDGTEYRFDVLNFLTARSTKKGQSSLSRRLGILYASKVTDKHGNTVTYQYNSQRKLTSIKGSDGRTITLAYNSSGYISSVNAHGRTWTYQYSSASGSGIDNNASLTKVTQPDGRSWSFSMANWRTNVLKGHCTREPFTVSMTHPYGTKANFTLTETRLGKSGTPYSPKSSSDASSLSGCNEDYIYHIMPWFENLAVTEKVLSGPSIDTAVWNYHYQSDDGNFKTSESASDLRKTTITDPLGQKTEYFHNRRWGGKNGQLEKVLSYSSNGSLLRETRNTYITRDEVFGVVLPNLLSVDTASQSTAQYQTKSVVLQAGDTYTTENSYDINPSSSGYSYGLPTNEKRYSNVNTSKRDTTTTYQHLTSKWVLGLPKQVTTNGRSMETNIYDSLGRKTEAKAYGQRLATFGYHTNSAYRGALYWVKDANNRTTYAYNWKRGKPQQIKRPDGKSSYLTIDNHGWVTSAKDELGRTTAYSYDNMGRNTLINPHGSWSNTSISYQFGNTHTQTITKANARTVITYDNFFRPTLEQTRDLLTGKSSYVNMEYDALGQNTFQSFPSFSASSSAGVDMTYDALGRVVTERETVSPYATTSHRYLSSHRHRITDPLGHYQDLYAYGYEGPDSDNYRTIRMYDNSGSVQSYTNITQNIWGQTTQIRQYGSINGYSADQRRYYYYDSRQRLCRQREPEVGDTVMQYDNSGWLIAYQKGLSAGSSCSTPTGSAKVSFIRDSLGRPTKTDFASSSTPDITRTFDAVGNLTSINRAGANWSYSYNTLNLLEAETVNIDGRSYSIEHDYNLAGHQESKRLPSGLLIDFDPDGLGRATQAINGSTKYVDNVNYHATGAISSFTYGNSYSFSQTLNARTLPQRILSQYSSNKAMDFSYGYDAKGQLTSISDSAISGNNRTNNYDGSGRIISASGPWGSGSFVYDSLGNIRKKDLGSRRVTVNYNSLNRATQSVDTGGLGGNTGTRSFSYDTRGNVTQAGNQLFTYDYADQPISLSGASSGEYQYDGNLKRIMSTVDGISRYHIYDYSGQLVMMDNVSENEVTEYVYVAGKNVARIENGSITYLHNDVLGSPVAGTNSSRSILWRERFTPYGITLDNHVSNDNQVGYTGHVKDSDTGLVYMQARYYDPVIGRFYSNDPVGTMGHLASGNVQGFNRYAYANNNPYKYTDPDGRTPVHAIALGVRACASNAACSRAAVAGGKAVVRGVTRAYNAIAGVFNASSDVDSALDGIKDGTTEAQGEAGEKGQLEGANGQQGAEEALDSLPGQEGSEWESTDGSRKGKTLTDGSKANVHPSGGGDSYPKGTPTLEVQRPKGTADVKIRYPENNSGG